MVTYNGFEYRTRDLLVDLDGRMEITIAGIELSQALLNDDDMPHDDEAERIDNLIYYFVDDINAPAEEIAKNGLDEEMTLIEEL